jgi:hypothetical protein
MEEFRKASGRRFAAPGHWHAELLSFLFFASRKNFSAP